MQHDDPTQPFVQRVFELDGRALAVRFFAPRREPTGEYCCAWTIAWPDGAAEDRTFGEDAVQALMLAMQAAHMDLTGSAVYQAGRLTLWGQHDLDLPPGWGAGPLYAALASPADPSEDSPPSPPADR
ncbi:DUF6968 family protein [Luteimonas abyssi]|uniref:DUF6968 family protein n=1 Tax=Luteimonas abyssi TaxID=1247514 RepID=UPI000737D737|nr:hypothetical protein [Luteimonas abyssi]